MSERQTTGAVSSGSPVNGTEFATTSFDRLRILSKYRTIAMVGLSSNPFRPSHFAAIYMLAEGYNVIAVNPRERADVGGHLLQRPGRLGRLVRAALAALVDQDQPVAVAERVEVIAELVVVEAGAAVQDQQRVAAAALHDIQARVADVYVPAGRLVLGICGWHRLLLSRQ
jgi:hypothetical protein